MTTEASLKLGVDSTEVKTAEKALADLAKAGSTAEQSTKNLGDEAKKAAAASDQMTTGFSGATNSIRNLVGAYISFQTAKTVLTGVITTTAEFSQSIANLSAITGATGKDLEFYAEQAKEIGRTTTLSASQAAEGFKLIASAKPDLLASAESLAEVTNQAVILAEATGSTLPEAASALGSALNQFQLPASDASRVINALAASSQFGTAEVGAVTEAMRNAGSAANSLGLDFEETVAGIQALAASGRQGADAGTALRQVLLKLEATGNENLQPSLVGLVGSLDELKSMNLDNTELMDLFGQEAFTAATSLLAQSDVAKELNVSLRGTNTAVEQAAVNMDTLSADYLKAKNAAQALQITLGESLEPQLRSFTQATTAAIMALNNFFSPKMSNDELIESLGMIVDENGNLVESAEAAAAAAKKFQEGMRDTTTEAETLAEAVVVAGDAVEAWNEKTLLQIDALKNEQLALQMTDRAQVIFNATLKALANGAAPDAIAEIATLAAQNYDLKESQDAAKASLKLLDDSIKANAKEQQKAREEQARAEQAVQNTIVALENENLALGMTARAQAIFNVVTEEYSKGTAPEQIARIAELTAMNYDLAESSATTGKAAADAAAAAQKSWEATHEYLSEAFVDIMENGGNAFDNIAKAFERTVKRMVAEWAASGLMGLFAGNGLSGFTTAALTGGSGNLVGTTISSLFGVGSAATTATTAATVAANGGTVAAGVAGVAGGGAAAAGSGAMSTITAMATNPATIAVAAALALLYSAKNDFFKDPDGYKRSYAGLLTGPTTGAEGSTFAVDPFASGFRATGIARGASEEAAIAQIEVFRKLDAAGAELVKKLGGAVDLSVATLAGVGKEGTVGTAGTFLGQGGMTTAADIAAMTDLYMTQFADHITGLDAELLKAVQSAGSAEEVMKLLTDSVAEISDTAKNSAAELTDMERARKSASESVLAAYNSGLSELDSIEKAYEAFQKYAERGLTAKHISTFTGLMESEINSVIARGAALIQSVTKPATVNYDFWTPVTSTFQQSIRDSLTNNTADSNNPLTVSLAPGAVEQRVPMTGSFANGVDYVAYDGPAMLHRGEKVTSVAERNADALSNRRLAAEMSELKQEVRDSKVYNRRTFEILDRWAGTNFTVIT